MDERSRYIQLNGDPIHTSLKKAFWKAADFVYPCILTAFAAASTATANPDISISIISSGLKAALLGAAVGRFLELIPLSQAYGNRPNVCIDKTPDQSTSPIKPIDRFGAGACSFYFMVFSVAAGTEVAPLLKEAFSACQNPENFSPMKLTSVSDFWIAPVFFRYFSGAYRFLKVAKGDWVIIDHTPEKKKQEEEAPASGVLKPATVSVI